MKLTTALFVLAATAHFAASGAFAADVETNSDRAARCATIAKQAMKKVDAGEIAATTKERIAAYQQALELAHQALALDDKNADAHFVVFAAEGRITLLEGTVPNPYNLYKAQGKLDYVLELDPDHPNALAAKGGLYRQLPWALGGDLDKAEEYLKRSIAVNPNAIGARLELARTYQAKGVPEKCPALVDKALEVAIAQNKQHRIAEAKELQAELAAQQEPSYLGAKRRR